MLMVPNVEADTTGPTRPSSDARKGEESPANARVVAAWCQWLDALATDAEAALAAALAYRELDSEGRQSWLSALEHDVAQIKVPLIAVYGPLLAVEHDPARRQRIQVALESPSGPQPTPADGPVRALAGTTKQARISVIILPLYLDFVQVLACRYQPGEGFEWVKHDPIVDKKQAPQPHQCWFDAQLEPSPIKSLVDELAHAVLAHQRSGRKLPEALCAFAELFAPAPDQVASVSRL